MKDNAITVDFALEAKCYFIDNPVRVEQTSRLISRLRYRQFGILVTTSHVHHQAYKEIKEDGHPVIIITAIDIVNILTRASYNTKDSVRKWLYQNFPKT
ncbi:MAG: restriction endonuclease [Clostridiales bacterium]|nr:restriction endonuclease [Clostridiales bacterium]MCF8023143.1 restriction endonuclease [Clostridiales bacterium]